MGQISFNNIPANLRLPGSYTEVDNSKALSSTVPNPHKVLIIGQADGGTAGVEELKRITSEAVGINFFGAKSIVGRMCRKFKKANPYTDVYAIAIASAGDVKASANINFAGALSHAGGSVTTSGELLRMAINGDRVITSLQEGWSVTDINSAINTAVNNLPYSPAVAFTDSVVNSVVNLVAVNGGENGNEIDIRFNTRIGEEFPTCFQDSVVVSNFVGGANNPSVDSVWAVISNETFHHIICPYTDEDNLNSLNTELERRFGPMVQKQGSGYTAFRGTHAGCTTVGERHNSPFISILGYQRGQQTPEEWASVFGAVCSLYLNNDPARPIQTLPLPGIIPPDVEDVFDDTERNLLLFSGISTWDVDASNRVSLERIITTYRVNSEGIIDPSYLNIETMATLGEIRYQYKSRMYLRFLSKRFKLVGDNFPIQPGMPVINPKGIKQEIIALFVELQRKGLVEEIEQFAENLQVVKSSDDQDRVDVLLPADLVNQFRILASVLQFIL